MPDMHMHTDSIFSDKISLPEKPENRKRFFVNTRKHPKNPGNHTFFLLSLTVFLCDRKKPLKLRLCSRDFSSFLVFLFLDLPFVYAVLLHEPDLFQILLVSARCIRERKLCNSVPAELTVKISSHRAVTVLRRRVIQSDLQTFVRFHPPERCRARPCRQRHPLSFRGKNQGKIF